MFDLAILSPLQIGISLLIGIALGLIYLAILWKTLLYLPKVKNKGNFLFFSAVVRLFLIIFIALYFSYDNGARFLLIFIGFIITRLIVLKYIKNNVLDTLSAKSTLQKKNAPQLGVSTRTHSKSSDSTPKTMVLKTKKTKRKIK